jgi:flagellar biosynthesis chaperone FliJ
MSLPEQDPNQGARSYETQPVVTPVSGEPIAERFVQQELIDARKSLRMTQIGGTLMALFVAGYIGFITSHLNRTLEPNTAAQVATGLIADQVDTNGPQIAADIKQRIPQLIEQLPDYALKQMPQYRTALENQIENDMQQHFTTSSAELGKSFDELLDANKESIGQMLKDGQDPQAARQVGNAVEAEMLDYMKTTSVNGESLTTKLDEAYDSLSRVEKHMTKLADNKGLTPQEQKARRAIGILAQRVDTAQKASGITDKAI